MKVPKLETGQWLTLLYVAAFFIALFVVYKILAGVGLIKTAAKKKEEAAEANASESLRTADYFNPLLLKGKTAGYTPLGEAMATSYAEQLRKAVRGMGTDEEAIYSVFGQLHNRLNISEVALYYKNKYNRDLGTDLLNDLGDAERLELIKLIDKLPNK